MRRFFNFISRVLSTAWDLFNGAPRWVQVALIFFIIMKINPSVAVSLLMIGVCLWAIQHMFRSLIPKKSKKK